MFIHSKSIGLLDMFIHLNKRFFTIGFCTYYDRGFFSYDCL